MRYMRWVVCCVSCVTLCLCVSGCFYQRLLTFKKQLKHFDDYFVLEEEDTVSMIFKKPVMLTEDTERFLGAKPTAILGDAPNAVYEYRMVKQYAPNQKEEGHFDFTYQVVMQDNKIERFVFDRRFFAATPKPMFVRICKMFGHAKLNLAKRSLTMGKIDSEPYVQESVFLNAEEVRQLLGTPFEVALPPRDTTAPYYWRVDAIDSDGTLHPGELWSFSPGAIKGRWTFDDDSGRIAHDVSGAGNHGTLQGNATFQPDAGLLGGAVYLDGVGAQVHVNDVSLDVHTITVTAWIKGHQVSGGAWLFHFEDALRDAGFHLCGKDHLHYTWTCDAPNVGEFHSPALPREEWVFIAGVVDYDQATLYAYTRSKGLKASVNKAAHLSQSVSKFILGHFIGLMDDVRLYNYALTREQIEGVINGDI